MKWDRQITNEWDGSGPPIFFIKWLVKRWGCSIQLHYFVQPDRPGCFHTHPAWAFRLVLWGGYREEMGDGRMRRWFPGRFGIVPPTLEHRIDGFLRKKQKGSLSIWFRGPITENIETRGC